MSLDDKIDRILQNTTSIQSDLAAYQQSNDTRVLILEDKLNKCIEKLEQFESGRDPAALSDAESIAIRAELELTKQQALKNNICFHGISSKPNENVEDTAKALLKSIGLPWRRERVVGIYRTKPSNNSPGFIIMKMASFEQKMEIFRAKKAKPLLKVKDLGLNLPHEESRIFANNHLTPYYSALLSKAKSLSLDGYFKSIWLSNNGIMVKLQDDSQSCVKSEDELIKIVSDISSVVLSSDNDEGINGTTTRSTEEPENFVTPRPSKRAPRASKTAVRRRKASTDPLDSSTDSPAKTGRGRPRKAAKTASRQLIHKKK